ncbi:MAG: family 43 glycosylhydrolase, partial [Candidatus Saccharibacteria bacterium]|nr:family 43 glycosylhydrolase [Microbacteriaceae bacterium]
MVRVGRDHFLANSTLDCRPGVTVCHSTDLVNWRIVGAAVTRPARCRRDGQIGAVSFYAPTFHYAQGEFVLVCRNVAAGQGNFLITKDAPAGEWTDGVWLDDAGFDPSLLYNEGVWYYTRRTLDPRPDGYRGPVVQAILDIATGELGVLHQLTPGYGGYSSDDTERPHLCYVSDWYYPFSADGGPWKSHTQTCSRGRLSWGMFEPAPHNPMITHRHRVGHPIQTLGHADLVDTPDGAWSVLSNGTRNLANGEFVGHHNLGCDTFLIPIDWQDGWPVLGKGGTTELCVDA